MQKWLRKENRQGQIFYNGVKKLEKKSKKRPYFTPLLFLVIKHYAERFDLVECINSKVEWDPSQWKISPGILGLTLIYVCFLSEDGRIPLYKIPDKLRGLDLFLLLNEPLHADDFSADQFATLLERLGEIGHQNLLSGIIDQVYELFEMPKSMFLHSDTTSHIMYGAYEVCDIDGFEGLVITWGHSKDHRQDRKQTKTGLIVDGNGVIRFACALDGNESDSSWNTQAIKDLKTKLGNEIELHIYIADSKLVSLPNLKEINEGEYTLKFISLVPGNFNHKTSAEIRKRAYEADSWEYLGKCCENPDCKDRAEYSIIGFTEEIEGKSYRLIAIKSTKTLKNVTKKVETEKADLIILAEKAFPKNFKCEPDAKEAIKHFQKSKKTALYKFIFDIIPIEEEKKFRGPKPREERDPEFVTVYKVVIKELVPDNDKIEALKRKEESFVLITNVSADELTDREVLMKYKTQGVVERSFSRLKSPMMVDTLFLKTPKRVEALMAIVYIALLFQSIMQATARYRANNLQNLPKIKYAKRDLINPTYEFLTYLLEPFVVITSGHNIERSCNVPELERHFDLILFLLDAEEC